MPAPFHRLVERQIAKAIAEGQLDRPEGAGKPLPRREGEAYSDMAMQVAGRIMAEAGALPEEFKLKKLLEAARAAYAKAQSDEETRLAMALIADLELRHNIAAEARRKFMAP